MIVGLLLILIGIILLWKGKFWKYNYETDSKIQDKLRFFFAGLTGIVLGILTIIDSW